MAAKVYIVYYSTYGHVEKLAEQIKKGAESVEGVEAKLWQVPETLSDEVKYMLCEWPICAKSSSLIKLLDHAICVCNCAL